jgi:hypothetical protein
LKNNFYELWLKESLKLSKFSFISNQMSLSQRFAKLAPTPSATTSVETIKRGARKAVATAQQRSRRETQINTKRGIAVDKPVKGKKIIVKEKTGGRVARSSKKAGVRFHNSVPQPCKFLP